MQRLHFTPVGPGTTEQGLRGPPNLAEPLTVSSIGGGCSCDYGFAEVSCDFQNVSGGWPLIVWSVGSP